MKSLRSAERLLSRKGPPIFLAVFLASFFPLKAQIWTARYGGTADSADYARKLEIYDGHIYVGGDCMNQGSRYDITLIKYSTDGNELWAVSHDGPEHLYDLFAGFAFDGSSGLYITGSTQTDPLPHPRYDIITLKYNVNGELQWAQTYNGPGEDNDIAEDIAVNEHEGTIVVVGESKNDETQSDFLLLAYDSTGDLLWWDLKDGENDDDYAKAVAVDDSGNVYVAGYMRYASSIDDFVTIKYSTLGISIWTAVYSGGTASDMAYLLEVDNDGNAVVAGKSQSPYYDYDFLLLKYDPEGTLLWSERYDGGDSLDDYPTALELDAEGNIYLTGVSNSNSTYKDIVTLKYSPDGEVEWVARYDGPGLGSNDISSGITIESTGLFVTGTSNGFNNTFDYVVLKYSLDGQLLWAVNYNGPDSLDDISADIAANDGYLYVTGSSYYSETNYDFVTLKYPSEGQSVEWSEGERKRGGIKVVPNPMRDRLTISLTETPEKEAKIQIYSVSGRLVRTIRASSRKTIWDGKNERGVKTSAGVYVIFIEIGEQKYSRAFLLAH